MTQPHLMTDTTQPEPKAAAPTEPTVATPTDPAGSGSESQPSDPGTSASGVWPNLDGYLEEAPLSGLQITPEVADLLNVAAESVKMLNSAHSSLSYRADSSLVLVREGSLLEQGASSRYDHDVADI